MYVLMVSIMDRCGRPNLSALLNHRTKAPLDLNRFVQITRAPCSPGGGYALFSKYWPPIRKHQRFCQESMLGSYKKRTKSCRGQNTCLLIKTIMKCRNTHHTHVTIQNLDQMCKTNVTQENKQQRKHIQHRKRAFRFVLIVRTYLLRVVQCVSYTVAYMFVCISK